MILVFHDKEGNVHVNEYEFEGGVSNLVKEDVYPVDYRDSVFYVITGIPNDFLASVLMKIQYRFNNNRVFVFEKPNQTSLHDMPEMLNMLFVYRKDLSIIQASISEEDVEDITRWLANHM